MEHLTSEKETAPSNFCIVSIAHFESTDKASPLLSESENVTY